MNTPINIKIAELLFQKHGVLLSNISDVVMWLYEKHGVWIYARPYDKNKWYYIIIDVVGNGQKDQSNFNSPTEAYEAAILYTLNNLI